MQLLISILVDQHCLLASRLLELTYISEECLQCNSLFVPSGKVGYPKFVLETNG